jgi:PAS domain S-box-containing protein
MSTVHWLLVVSSAPPLPPLLRDAPLAVASLDLSGHIFDANRALLAAGGYTLDELRGRPFFEFLDPVSAPDARRQFTSLASGEVPTYRGERRYRARDGVMHDVQLTVSLVRDADGAPAGCLAVLHDVSEHRRALLDTARKAAELEAVIESMPAAVYIIDRGGVKVANRLGLQQLGFRDMEDMGAGIAQVAARLHLRDAATGQPIPVEQRAATRALRGERVDQEVTLRHASTGEDRTLLSVAAPVLMDGRIVGAVAISQDITEQRATEEARRVSESRYRALIEQSPLSVQIFSPDGTTVQVNAAWERLWGVTLADLGPYNIRRDPQLVQRGLMPTIERAFNGEAGQLEAILYDPDQTVPDKSSHADPRRWVRATIYPLKDAAGNVREVVLVHEDMTDQMRAEEQRRAVEAERERLLVEAQKAHRELQTASRVKDEFLATLSHELRTPLNAVLGWARILRSRPASDQTAHAVEVIERNAIAQARLIDDLLDLSSIITGKTRLNVEEVDVAAVAGHAFESLRPAAEAKRIAMTMEAPADLPRLTADAHRLQQIFWNLLSNAVKFTEAGGRVLLSVRADRHDVVTEVTDTGIGVAPEFLPSVFDRFIQGDSSSTRAHSGLGLGLSIVRYLVELHGGTVSARSDGVGRGATFGFTLPRR